MKLKLIESEDLHHISSDYSTCKISKTGNFRFKKVQARMFKIKEGMRFVTALDEDEKVKKTVYFFVSDNDEGTKVIPAQGTFHLVIRPILTMIGISLPVVCKISESVEHIGNKTYEGFKLKFNV